MKKFLLSLAAVACGAMAMNATSYVLFQQPDGKAWEVDGTGFKKVVSSGDVTFTITTDQADSKTKLVNPGDDKYAWRVYKSSKFTITAENFEMKTIEVVFAEPYNDNDYASTWDVNAGWTGTLDGLNYTLVSDGLSTFTAQSNNIQTRIMKLIVSDEKGEISEPETPILPEGVIYMNSFQENFDGWTKENDTTLSEYSGWQMNKTANAPACVMCNAYYDGANHPADCWLMKEFDLAGYENVTMSVDQAFGWYFPTAQEPNYTVNVRLAGGEWNALTFTNFPVKGNGNWTSFETNTFDLSEYDGQKIEIGFRYLTDGDTSRAWELQNFILEGDKTGAVEGVAVDDNAPVVYYNLQGVKVNNPENGIFIQVKGNKVTKIAR